VPLSTPVKALALVVFLAAIAGATYAVQTTLGNSVETQLLSVVATRDAVNATPGHNVTYLVTVANRDAVSRDVVVEAHGVASGASPLTTVRGGSNATVFLTVSVPSGLGPGDHDVDVRVVSEGRVFREREGLLSLRVLPAAPGFAIGDVARASFTGRLAATGRVFNTNDRDLVGLNVPKTDSYAFSDRVLTVTTSPRPTVVQGVYEGMLGMQPGETRTFTFPPEMGYGAATDEEVFARDDILPRELTLDNVVQEVPRDAFDAYVEETGQGAASNFTPGKTFLLEQNRALWPYRIVNMTNESVQYQLGANVGDAFTVYPFWENASVVSTINDTTVVFRTTPTTPIGDPFTFRVFWPEMSSVASVNETSIAVRHSPPLGYSYAHVGASGTPRQASIKEVSEQRIVLAIPSQNPLAGKDLTFDVTLLSLDR